MARKGFRDSKDVQQVLLRMGRDYISELDALCKANGRSRREIVEYLVREAKQVLDQDPGDRINPI